MINHKTVAAIILAAGSSTRFGLRGNKNYQMIHNKAVIMYSFAVFNSNKNIDEIIFVIRQNEKSILEKLLAKEKMLKKVQIVVGGQQRCDSVYNALQTTAADIVVIHDGVRPCIDNAAVDKQLKHLDKYMGTTLGVKAKDTIKIADEDGVILNTTKRDNTWLIQTPQCFERSVLLKAYEKIKDKTLVTDDCALLEKMNYPVKIIEGDYKNIKITTPSDIIIASSFLEKK